MFSNSHHSRGAQAHPSAAAAAAYFGYGGYPGPQHQHFGPQPHYHYSAAAVAAAAAAHAASSPGPAELSACGGLLAPSPDNPAPSPSGELSVSSKIAIPQCFSSFYYIFLCDLRAAAKNCNNLRADGAAAAKFLKEDFSSARRSPVVL